MSAEEDLSTEGSSVTPGGESQRICTVCDGVASGMYFGSLVCLPCKSFFIRSTKDGEPNFQCVTNRGSCDILLANRLRCQFCRYQKCLKVGMCRKEKPEVVDVPSGQKQCDVCHDIANGIHFGVPTCEGCKKFFRRGMKEAEIYECKLMKKCPINPRNRNTCRYCRYQRCLAVGMSKQAIQMGRPKKDTIQGKRILQSEKKESARKDMFDGPQLCAVCKDVSSGIHFSVTTCEDCKMFFMYGMREAENLKCTNNMKCVVELENKSTCYHCWYQKCLAAGMKTTTPQPVSQSIPIYNNQTACSPKRYRSESSVTEHLPDYDNISYESAHNTGPGYLPVHSIPSRQHSLGVDDAYVDIKPSPPQQPLPEEMDLHEVLRKVETEFPMRQHMDSFNNLQNGQSTSDDSASQPTLYDLVTSTESDQTIIDNSFMGFDIQRFAESPENFTTEMSSKMLDMNHTPEVLGQVRAFDRAHVCDKEEQEVGYFNEESLQVVNNFYDHKRQTDEQSSTSMSPRSVSSKASSLGSLGEGSYSETSNSTTSATEEVTVKVEAHSAENNSDLTNAVFSSRMKHSHPDSSKLDEMYTGDSDPSKRVILEKQKAKLSLFSRYYWKTPLTLHSKVINSSQTILVIARIIKAYKVFLVKTDESQAGQIEANQEKTFPEEKPKHAPFFEVIKNRIMNNTRACVEFVRSSLTVPMYLNQDDAKVLFFYGGFQAMIVLSTRERYNSEEKSFQYFWNWKVPPKSPAFLFRQNLLKAAEDLNSMKIDITESAVMCVLSVISSDWIILREPDLVEKLRKPIITAFQEYLSVKYGSESKRGEALMAMMPVLRELTLWHSEMLTHMKLSIKTEEMDGLFKSLCL